MSFSISSLQASDGELGICPAPGRFGNYEADLAQIRGWAPELVLSMTETSELARIGAETFPRDLACGGIKWIHLPIRDFGVPQGNTLHAWPEQSRRIHTILSQRGRVLVHCLGGCGRSGMVIMRVLVELGEAPEKALFRLRNTRPCAVETDAQYDWAIS